MPIVCCKLLKRRTEAQSERSGRALAIGAVGGRRRAWRGRLAAGPWESAQALELALELGCGPALDAARGRASNGDSEQHVGGHPEECGELRNERDGEPQTADIVVRESGNWAYAADDVLGLVWFRVLTTNSFYRRFVARG